ncbi:MAG: hypothetical protein HY296_07765 [Thaumarchaeota archaeon]|nr:hypothetical protein [Nitrososphaerota archaeon]
MLLSAVVSVAAVLGLGYYLLANGGGQDIEMGKPIILYVNQGNGIVNGSGFGTMLSFATSHGFNTVFFQVYRHGVLLFSTTTLRSFVTESHSENLSFYFSLYITNRSQSLPVAIYGLGEDGISLDMSTVDRAAQRSLLASLNATFAGRTAVTTYDFGTTLKPDLLVLETYGSNDRQFIQRGIIGSVEPVATTGQEDYQSQYGYALQNSDGVMVFDYYGLMRMRY